MNFDQDDVKQAKEVTLCPFWSLIGRCDNEANTDMCILGKHSTVISVELECNRIAEARKLSQHFLRQLKDINTNNSCYNDLLTSKSHSMLLASVYDYLADLSIIDQEYEIADVYLDKANKVYPFYYKRILKQIEMLEYFIPDKHDKIAQLVEHLRDGCTENNPDLIFRFALFLRQWNHIDESITCFEQAIELQDKNIRYLREYAFTLYKKGLKFYPQAFKIYQKILKMAHCDEKTKGCCQRMIDKIIKSNNFDIKNLQEKADFQTECKQETNQQKSWVVLF